MFLWIAVVSAYNVVIKQHSHISLRYNTSYNNIQPWFCISGIWIRFGRWMLTGDINKTISGSIKANKYVVCIYTYIINM